MGRSAVRNTSPKKAKSSEKKKGQDRGIPRTAATESSRLKDMNEVEAPERAVRGIGAPNGASAGGGLSGHWEKKRYS